MSRFLQRLYPGLLLGLGNGEFGEALEWWFVGAVVVVALFLRELIRHN